MRANAVNDGDDSCPWGVAAAADERPFFGGPIRFGPLVDLSQFVCTNALVTPESRSHFDPPSSCAAPGWAGSFPVDVFDSSTPALRPARGGMSC
jgi:hypothetical protein